MIKKISSFIGLLFLTQLTYATHNQAGDITYKHLGGLTYQITVTIFAEAESRAISRKEIQINWGDGTGTDSLNITSETPINGSILKRVWVGTHTYPGPGSFKLRVEDPNRNASVDNIDNSVKVPFTIETLLRIVNQASERNNSVVLRNDPVDEACLGSVYRYNPGAIDPDGDSIAYAISESKAEGGQIAPGYQFPPASNSISVDPENGDLIWDSPNQIGLYNVAILIREYRNQVLISEVLRDLQIRVVPGCNNRPPIILADELSCIEAGSTLNLPIIGSDQDLQDDVSLTATGEVLEPPINNRTNFNRGVTGNPTNASFVWNTNCSDVRSNLYSLNIRAEDNGASRGVTSLVNFKTINIRVVAPPPENLSLSANGTSLLINWDNSACQNAEGYHIYRRIDSSGYVPDSCSIGVPDGLQYERIKKINDISITNFTDDNNGQGLVPGIQYCYLITSYFSDDYESKASAEICGEVEKVVPVMTEVSVNTTDGTNGLIDLGWSPPDSIDDIAFPAPYQYLIIKQTDNNNEEVVDSTAAIDDTLFTTNFLNTEALAHQYSVQLYSYGNGKQLVGQSAIASSIFLSIEATDEVLQLSWNDDTPWLNEAYTIFRQTLPSPTYDSLTTTSNTSFNDSNLVNGKEYCYYIRSKGSYNLQSVKTPLLNLSQRTCSRPIDNISPCNPELSIDASCKNDNLTLSWNNIINSCATDLESFRIFYSSSIEGDLTLFEEINNRTDTTYSSSNENEIAGCYAIQAVDSTGNESAMSEIKCVDFCPVYDLPNVFTPNGDGNNDLYTPILPYRYVDSIDLKVYNRWGQIVFETADPSINWNGENQKEGQLVSDGVYYYTCLVFEQSLDESKEARLLKGTITVLDSKSGFKED